MDSGDLRTLWQSVLVQAVSDALSEINTTTASHLSVKRFTARACERRIRSKECADADSWLRGGGKDFRHVCSLAGFDPDFIRDSYVSGRMSKLDLDGSALGRARKEREKK